MHTLLQNSNDTRWFAQPINTYRANFNLGDCSRCNNNLIKSNIAYSMQYLELLEKQISELKLTTVLKTMIYKTYIITSMSIIESLFVNLLKSQNHWKTDEWKLLLIAHSNTKNYETKKLKVDSTIYEKVTPYDVEMTLDSMIKTIEAKNLLPVQQEIYTSLKKLRKLRNKVHLQEGANSADHDYNNFNEQEYKKMREILHTILTCEVFCRDSSTYDFLIN